MSWKDQKRENKARKSLLNKRQFNKESKKWQKERKASRELNILKKVRILEKEEGGKVDES